MKRLFLFVFTALLGASLSAQEYLPKWQEGYLDIHTVSTGRGDATFIVMPDGTTMLVDAGDNGKAKDKQHPSDSLRAGDWLARYIKHFMTQLPGEAELDYALITHLHDDHFGSTRQMLPGENGYGLSGITLVGERVPIKKLVDRIYPDYDFPSKEMVAKYHFIKEYWKFCDYQIKNKGMKMEQFVIGSDKQFSLLNNPNAYKNFKIQNLAANGHVWTGKGLKAKKNFSGDPTLFDENVNSTAFKLTYGKFSYFNGGDLSGGNWPSYKSNERDMETAVAKVCGPVNAMKANHHGYYDTCNGFFMQTLNPEIIIVDARSNNHPVPSTMTRMADPLVWKGERDFYITVDQAKEKLGEKLWSHFKPWGHIVLRVYPNGESYQMFVLDADSLDYKIIYKAEPVKL